jgi:hypothetical protein
MVDDDVLLCVRYLFDQPKIALAPSVSERYYVALSSLKRKVLVAQMSGARYHQTEQMIRAEALREGLSAHEYEQIVARVEHTVDYSRLRVHYASSD